MCSVKPFKEKQIDKRNIQVEKQRLRFTATATKEQMKQKTILQEELRWNRSKIIRLAIQLMLKIHKEDPKRYGV